MKSTQLSLVHVGLHDFQISPDRTAHAWTVEAGNRLRKQRNICSVSVFFVRVGSLISPRRAKKDSNIPSPGIPWVPETFLARFPVSVKSLYSDPREKPLEQSAIALMAPIQSLARLNQLVQILDKTADWLLTTTWGTLNLTDATIGWQE